MVKKSADMIAVRTPQQRGAPIRGESLHGGRARGGLGGEVSKVRWDSLREELEECGGSWGGMLGCWEWGRHPNEASPLCLHRYHHNSFAFSSPMSEGLISGGSPADLKGILSCLVLSWLVSVGMTAGPCSVPY